MKKILLFLLFLILGAGFIYATSVGTSDLTKGRVIFTPSAPPTNYTEVGVNSSEIWITAEGNMDNVPDIDYSDFGGSGFWDTDVDIGSKSFLANKISTTGNFVGTLGELNDRSLVTTWIDMDGGLGRAGVVYLRLSGGKTIWADDDTFNLGSDEPPVGQERFKNLFLSNSAKINTLNISSGSITDSGGTIDFDNENIITTSNITISSDNSYLNFGDNNNANITFDGSDLVFNDPVAGKLTLDQISSPTKVEVSNVDVVEGDNSTVGLGRSKYQISWIRIDTTSVDWNMTIYTKDDYSTKPFIIVLNRNSDYDIYLDYPYEDEDNSGEFHYHFSSASGSETHNISLIGWGLR